VMLDPNAGATLTIEAIHQMADELIEAHGELLPDGIRARTPRRPVWHGAEALRAGGRAS